MYRRTDFSNNGMESLDMKPWARDHSNKVPTKKVAISLSPVLSISSNVCLYHFLHMMHIKHHGTIFQIFGLPIQFLQSTTRLITLIHLSKFKPTKLVTWLNCWYLNHVRCHLNWKLINLYFGIEEKCWFTVFSLFLHLIPCHINPTPTPQPHPWPEILKPNTSNPKNHSHARGPNHPITITTLLPKQHKSHKIPQNTELSLTHTHSSTKMA